MRFSARVLARLAGLCAAGCALAGIGAASAQAAGAPCYVQMPGAGQQTLPPWGFHTGPPLLGQGGSFALAWGDINLSTNRISGRICEVQFSRRHQELIMMTALSPILFHTHVAVLWGYPGNEIRTRVRVLSSSDASCRVGTIGVMTMYASYNGVRSDSIQFRFPAACARHDSLYHGPQVVAQVPPL
ncbi:MAG TPA: hypothetical protein VFN48_11330 [Solirubrobacteraceae bacterium]|nr:hypothetical protein [Solirubrobacteraceae bacterium]